MQTPGSLIDLIRSYRDSTRTWPATSDLWAECKAFKSNAAWALPVDGAELGRQLQALRVAGLIEEQGERRDKVWAEVERVEKGRRSDCLFRN